MFAVRRILLTFLAAATLLSTACRTVSSTEDDVSDPAVKARIEAVLRGRKDIDLKYVSVDVIAGVATLSGLVPTSQQVRLIRNLTANVHGVDQVLNNLLVQE